MKSEELRVLERIERHLRRLTDKVCGPESKKPKSEFLPVVAVTKNHVTGEIMSEDPAVPSGSRGLAPALRGSPPA